MRQCPTLKGDTRPLITQRIENPTCLRRQREFYHKCHRCIFNGQPMDFGEPEPAGRNGTVAHDDAEGRNGLPKPVSETASDSRLS